MKTSNLLLAGAAALAAYFLFTKGNVTMAATPTDTTSAPPLNQTDTYNQLAKAGGVTAADAIKIINENPSSIKRTSQTIAKGVSFTTSQGITYTGNIAQLGTGAKVAVAVNSVPVDASGKTAFDRMIERNKSAYLASKK